MVNAFPTIMNQIFKRNGLSTPFLSSYIEDREHILRENSSRLLSRQELKKLFLISLHLGDYLYNNDLTPIHFLSRFQTEIKSNAKSLLSNPFFSSLHDRALSLNKRNPLGTMISWVCQRAESEIMQAKTEYTERHCRVATNLFDGHLREFGEIDLCDCSRFVEERTGYQVSFVTKIHANTETSAPAAGIRTESTSSVSPTSLSSLCDIVAIRGDGHCILRLAGEINALLRDPNHFVSGYAPCLEEDLIQARAETVSNFTRWLAEKKDFFPSQEALRGYVFEIVDDSIEEFYNRVEGRSRGKGLLASNLDLGAFSRDKDVYLIILRTTELVNTSPTSDCKNAFTLCDFPGQKDKKKIAIVILHKGHADLFVIRTSDGVRALFDIGADFDAARALALSFIRTRVKEIETGFACSLADTKTPKTVKWPKWSETFAAFELNRTSSPLQQWLLSPSTPTNISPNFSPIDPSL
jgi:hypothetical protein